MTWYYQDKELDSVPEGYYGFVYQITNLDSGRMYIGRKYFYSTRKLPPLKGKKRKRVVRSESDWKTYFGSSSELLEDVRSLGDDKFHREILVLCKTKGETNQTEVELQFKFDVLRSLNVDGTRMFYNKNIMNRYFVAPENHSEKSKQKISDSQKEFYESASSEWKDAKRERHRISSLRMWAEMSPEEKKARLENLHAANPMFTEDGKNHISLLLTGRSLSEKTKEKISKSLKEYWSCLSKDEYEDLRTKMSDRVPWNFGMSREELLNHYNKIPEYPSQKGTIKIHNPATLEESNVRCKSDIPEGWKVGRSPSVDPGRKPCIIHFDDGTKKEYSSALELKEHFGMTQKVFEALVHKYDDDEYLKRRRKFKNVVRIEYK